MDKIIKNVIKCKKCGDVIESVHVHDYKWCSCGQCAVDGGKEYLRRSFATATPEEAYEDLSITEKEVD